MDGWKRQNDSLRTMFASVLFEPVPLRLLPTSVVPPKAVSPCRASATEPKRERTGASAPDRPAGLVATTMLGVALVAFAAGALASFGTDDFGLSPRARAMPPVEDADALQEERTFTARATETHSAFLSDLVRPVELTAADEPRLLRWLQHSLSGALRIPNLQSQGWTLIGGRVVPGQHGPAGFLVYGNGTDKLGLIRCPNLGFAGWRSEAVGERGDRRPEHCILDGRTFQLRFDHEPDHRMAGSERRAASNRDRRATARRSLGFLTSSSLDGARVIGGSLAQAFDQGFEIGIDLFRQGDARGDQEVSGAVQRPAVPCRAVSACAPGWRPAAR